jgi:FKBP-type peptidyl-prolyl cis-trans isomerase 2
MVENGNRVSVEYTLSLDDGTVVTTNVGAGPFVYVQGEEQIPSALERQLKGLRVGDLRDITLSPEDAYGPVNPAEFRNVDIQSLPEEARRPGTFVEAGEPGDATRIARVHEVFPDHIVLDFNHKLWRGTVDIPGTHSWSPRPACVACSTRNARDSRLSRARHPSR